MVLSHVYAQIDATGRVVAVSDLARPVQSPELIAIPAYDETLLGKRWDGAAFVPVYEPDPVGRTYTQLAWLDAIGDEAALQIIAARGDDPVVELIDRKFQAASVVDTEHAATQQALDYLVASPLVPAFTQELANRLRGLE